MKPIWIIEAIYQQDFQIKLKFNDGTEGIVNLENKLKGPIFEPLKSKDYFKKFKLNSWTLEWPNGADLAPEFLYELIGKNMPVS